MAGEDELLFGVIHDDDSSVVDALAEAGVSPVVDSPGPVLAADPDAIVAVGEPALLSVARRRPTVPILPVDAGAGLRSVPEARLSDAVTRIRAGDWTTEHHPLLTVDVDDVQGSLALFDAMTVTAEPAHISEYTVTAGGERVARFRADGLVVATPAGTRGYAQSAGAPVIPPGPDVIAIVPVAPFATSLDHWVVPTEDVTITVERDDATVDVLADDRTVGVADYGEPVRISGDGAIETIRVPEGQSPFAAPGTELEKL
jgi:NAD+ kinase